MKHGVQSQQTNKTLSTVTTDQQNTEYSRNRPTKPGAQLQQIEKTSQRLEKHQVQSQNDATD